MSLKKIHDQQPEFFEFTKINKDAAEKILKKYPENKKKSAVMPFLYLTQRQPRLLLICHAVINYFPYY